MNNPAMRTPTAAITPNAKAAFANPTTISTESPQLFRCDRSTMVPILAMSIDVFALAWITIAEPGRGCGRVQLCFPPLRCLRRLRHDLRRRQLALQHELAAVD